MGGILWAIIVILFVFWVFGVFVAHFGALVHIAIAVVVILVIVNLIRGRGARV